MRKSMKGISELLFLSLITSMAASMDSGLSVVVGGLFPVHGSNPNTEEPCDLRVSEEGFQEAMAFKYAIDLINRNFSYWNFKMEGVVLDTCDTESYALEQSRKFLKNNCRRGKLCTVVGASRSEVSIAVAKLFNSFQIPQVSYASTSPKLDDLEKFPRFFRVVPSDKFIMKAILDILMKFEWNYVSMVFSEGEYGENAAPYLKELIRNTTQGVCIGALEILPKVPTHRDFSKAVQRLHKQEKTKIAVVFLNEEMTRNLLSLCEELYVPYDRFIWIFSNRWTFGKYDHFNHTKGSIAITSRWFSVQGYDPFLFLQLNDTTLNRDPWIDILMKNQQYPIFLSNYTQDRNVPMVIDSVFLLASAIRNFWVKNQDIYNSTKNTSDKYKEITDYIANTKIKSSQSHNITVSFDENRDIPVQYTIYQYRRCKRPPYYKHIPIGEWNQDKRLTIWTNPMWFTKEGERREGFPMSSSNETCHDFSCLDGQFLTFNKTWLCVDQEVIFLGRSIKSPWAWVPLFLSIVGIMCTCGVIAIFLIYNKTPIIMASGRVLCYITLGGIILCYSFAFFILLEPTKVSCVLVKVTMSLGITVIYSALFVRLNQIYRTYKGPGVSTCPWSRWDLRLFCLTPKSQILICTILIFIQLMLSGIWLAVEPATVYSVPLGEKQRLEFCILHDKTILFGLIYNIFLLGLSVVYGYKTRKIRENLNETKWISFMMYSSGIGWMAFLLNYFSKLPDYKAQSTVISMGMVMSGNVCLVCIFLPKIYVVLFKPERNVRRRSSEQVTYPMGGRDMTSWFQVPPNENR